MHRLLPKTLTRKAMLSAILIGSLALGNVLVIQWLLHDTRNIAATINLAGKLRVLSQRMGVRALVAQTLPEPAGASVLETLHYRFMLSAHVLRKGGTAFGLTVPALHPRYFALLDNIERAQETHLASIMRMEESGDAGALLANGTELLVRTETLIDALTHDAEHIQARANAGILILFVLDLLLLLLGGLVFRWFVIRPLNSLTWQSRELAGGNYAARTHMRAADELGLLGHTLNDLAAGIESLLQRLGKEHRALEHSTRLFTGLAQNSLIGIFVLDAQLRFTYANAQLARILGRTQAELVALRLDDVLHEGNTEDIRRLLHVHPEDPAQHLHREWQARRKDGRIIDIEWFGSLTTLSGRKAVVGILVDISERKRTEAAARRAAQVYEHSVEAMILIDPRGRVQDINPSFTAITGHERTDIIGRELHALCRDSGKKHFLETAWPTLLTQGHWRGDLQAQTKSGDAFIGQLTLNATYRPDGSISSYVGLLSDVTEQRRREASIWRQAHFDPLTELPNRKMFNDTLVFSVAHAQAHNARFALIFIDLDRFKEVNDAHGHALGDLLLQHVAQRLRNAIRYQDTLARLAGDEFTLIIQGFGQKSDLVTICEKILVLMAKPYTLAGHSVTVSASIGVSIYPSDATRPEVLLRQADHAMYAAKHGGRNRYCFYADLHTHNTAQAD